MKSLLLVLASWALLTIAGCGGSGAGAGGSPQGARAASSPASMTLGVSSPTIGSDGTDKVNVVATVKDANNVALPGQSVAFSTTDGGSVLSVTTGVTDPTGVALATLSITDPTNRAIVINAASGVATASVTVRVAGSSVVLSGASSISFGGDSTYIVALKNSASAPLTGAAVILESSRGNAVSPLTAGSDITDVSGQARFLVTGNLAGIDTLTAKAQGISQSQQVTVSGDVATVDLPQAGAEVPVNTPQVVTARFLQNGVPLPANSQIQFSATRGTLSNNSAPTDANGVARITIQSTSAGFTQVTATAAGGAVASLEFEFVSRIPGNIRLQASPTTISVNPEGAASSTSLLLARVKDVSGNPVKGVRVDFSADDDPSSGNISPPFALTDSAGIASAAFVAGPNSSGFDLVQVRARIPSTSLTHTANLTVAAQALSVRIHTGNVVETPDPLTYSLPYTAVVSDTAGNPVEGARVTTSYVPTWFYKGRYVSGTGGWTANHVARCPSEDTNGNGVLDGQEDVVPDGNGNGVLDPGNVATTFVTTTGGTTDVSGFALIAVKYPRGFAQWVEIRLQVTITAASGTETVTSTEFILPALAADLTNTETSPPGGVASRFGVNPGCDDPD